MEFNPNNTIIYTALIGQNEGLNSQPFIKKSSFRHVCLTDNNDLKSDDWEIINVKRLLPIDQHRSQRNLKLRPHIVFPDYKYSFYFDNTIVLKSKIEDLIKEFFVKEICDINDPFFVLPFHSYRENLISEFYECYLNNLDSDTRFFYQISDYLKIDSLAFNFKPYWGGMLFRHHNHKKIIEFSEIWFANVMTYSRRDQLSIIHSAIQAELNLKGFDLDLFSSDFHTWPVIKKERINRGFDRNLFKISNNFFEKLFDIFSLTENEIIEFDFDTEIKKVLLQYKNSAKELESLRRINKNLSDDINSIKDSRIWKNTKILRKIIDKFKSNKWNLLKKRF